MHPLNYSSFSSELENSKSFEKIQNFATGRRGENWDSLVKNSDVGEKAFLMQ